MNGTKTLTTERNSSQYEELSYEEREKIAEKRRRRRRNRKIKNAIVLSLCAVIIVACIALLVLIVSGNFDFSKTTYGDFPDEKIEQKEVDIYASFPYYKEEYKVRYESYAILNPEMTPEDIVWRVNANQDKPKYGYDIPVSGYDDVRIIVNKYYKVPDDYKPTDMVSVDGQMMRKEAADAFFKMRGDAAASGLKIRAVSGYRTVSYQRGLYNRYLAGDSRENVDRYSARPGYSEHHTGLAVDVFGSIDGLRQFENTPEYPWVRDNCYKYGYIIRYLVETEDITGYESEPWHLRYVGVDVSTDMKEKGINNYEEYYAKYLQ